MLYMSYDVAVQEASSLSRPLDVLLDGLTVNLTPGLPCPPYLCI